MLEKTGHLFKLKEWLTISEAAKYLSKIFGEEVNESDVLRLGIDGHLKLSVYFVNGAIARRGKVVSYEEAEWYPPNWISISKSDLPDKFKNIKELGDTIIMKSLNIDNHRYLNLEEDITPIRGVWDLAMIGNEAIDIEFEYNQLINGPEVTSIVIDGTFVEDVDDKRVMCQIQESYDDNEFQSGSKAQLEGIKEYIIKNNIDESRAKNLLDKHKKNREIFLARNKKKPSDGYFPAGKLPSDSVIVVRTQALVYLQNQIMNKEENAKKSIDARAETTYLNIIGALLECVTGQFKDQEFSSETALREFIDEKFDDLKGVRARTLAEKFALAKKALRQEL